MSVRAQIAIHVTYKIHQLGINRIVLQPRQHQTNATFPTNATTTATKGSDQIARNRNLGNRKPSLGDTPG